MRQPHQFFRIEVVGQARGICPGIGQPVIHGCKPCCVRVAKVSHLDRGGLYGKERNPVSGSVPGKINQDIDFVPANLIGNGYVVYSCDIREAIDTAGKRAGNLVWTYHV